MTALSHIRFASRMGTRKKLLLGVFALLIVLLLTWWPRSTATQTQMSRSRDADDNSYEPALMPRRHSKSLGAYGFEPCPWMALPHETRYPRMRPAKPPPRGMLACFLRLSEWQEKGDIVFVLMEGQGLSAQMSGGYHGNDDDDDLDMQIFSRKNVSHEEHYHWCDDVGGKLGSYGFYTSNDTDNNVAAFAEDGKSGRGKFGEAIKTKARCIGEWEGIDTLLPNPSHHYFRELHGGSYWVPPVQGGKHMGKWLVEYMNPDKSLFEWFHWLEKFVDGLKKGVDSDGNGSISAEEFFLYVRGCARVNQRWLSGAIQEQPCVVANALVHYQFVMEFGQLARSLRQRCDGDNSRSGSNPLLGVGEAARVGGVEVTAAVRKTCAEVNFKMYKAVFGSGPEYFEEDGSADRKCTALMENAVNVLWATHPTISHP